MPVFLLKTEPSDYSFADLEREGGCTWSGVSSPAAVAALRTVRRGDETFIYHTGTEKAVVGLAKFTTPPRADPARPDVTADGQIRFAVVDLAAVRRAKTPLTLSEIKADKRFSAFALVTQSRLSVMPVPPALAKLIRAATGL